MHSRGDDRLFFGGFAAKEVVVATLGTAYSLGEVKPREAEGLGEKLRKEPGWNPLMAFTIILVLLALLGLCIVFAVAYKIKGLKFAFISSAIALVVFAILYVVTIYVITRMM